MKSTGSLALAACLIPSLVAAQDRTSTTESPFANARRIVSAGGGHMEETRGVLLSDPQRKELRFDAGRRAVFALPYDRIAAMHYEERKFPERFLKRSSFYLTIHYLNAVGQTGFETIRFLSEGEGLSALDRLEGDTGLTFDRTPATQSFLGIPIRASVGDRVTVTDQTGQRTTGTIRQLSGSSLTLEQPTGASRIFDEAQVQRIRLPYSPRHDALWGLAAGVPGALLGGLVGSIGWHKGCGFDCPRISFQYALGYGAISGGIGAGIAVAIGRVRHPFNNFFDVYRNDSTAASKMPRIAIVPRVAKRDKSVLVSVGF